MGEDGARNESFSGDWGYEPDLGDIEHEEHSVYFLIRWCKQFININTILVLFKPTSDKTFGLFPP